MCESLRYSCTSGAPFRVYRILFADLKVLLLSDTNLCGIPRLPENRFRQHIKALAVKSGTSSK